MTASDRRRQEAFRCLVDELERVSVCESGSEIHQRRNSTSLMDKSRSVSLLTKCGVQSVQRALPDLPMRPIFHLETLSPTSTLARSLSADVINPLVADVTLPLCPCAGPGRRQGHPEHGDQHGGHVNHGPLPQQERLPARRGSWARKRRGEPCDSSAEEGDHPRVSAGQTSPNAEWLRRRGAVSCRGCLSKA